MMDMSEAEDKEKVRKRRVDMAMDMVAMSEDRGWSLDGMFLRGRG